MKTEEQKKRDLLEHGKRVLESFHTSYEEDPVGTETEFRRGQFINWRYMLGIMFGERVAEEMILQVREMTRLSIPPAGPLAEDGQGYIGWDSGCDIGYIGK